MKQIVIILFLLIFTTPSYALIDTEEACANIDIYTCEIREKNESTIEGVSTSFPPEFLEHQYYQTEVQNILKKLLHINLSGRIFIDISKNIITKEYLLKVIRFKYKRMKSLLRNS